ncbi:hypothetical protein K431DRAFT_307685 [Polychaeton citri CBS 116435]|uniref:Oxidase cueO n=1 Tax=Polychaeton citri CBS 116435 TaxID=1314669 RepID=A0A9P4UKA2_9PEZI|nr:hypothetical protein K431DRAFT_307685 [Polychaeton citri CBS 116435]
MTSTKALLALLVGSAYAGIKPWDSPEYKDLFQYPVPVPQVKIPLKSYSSHGVEIDYYEVEIKPTEQQVYPNLGKTKLVGYDGQVPGPTFMMKAGREAVVRFINHGTQANSVHLHGSYSRAPFDGWAEDLTQPGEYKDYYYPNGQNARTLWYHDHAIDHTAKNAYFGQAGFYILHDDEELSTPGLPQGNYDIPLALSAKRYNKDGTLWDPEVNNEKTSVYGDVFHVNGQPWPYLKVEPRKYRFRFLDASISRSFQMYLEADTAAGKRIPFTVVGADTGLNEKPVSTTQLDISMAERWEVVVDFSGYAGKNLTLKNNRDVAADLDYPQTDKVMRFVVDQKTNGNSQPWDTASLPSTLRRVNYPPAAANPSQVDRSFVFGKSNGGDWTVNGHKWSDGPTERILAKPQRGAVEVWELVNGGGGWSHPVHIHLIDFQIISRKGTRGQVLPYEQVALKDVVWLNTGETVRVIARYAPWDGLYMFHCHNLIHEDHEMMVGLNVTALEDLGYDEKTRFIDPMEQKYRASAFSDSDYAGRSGPFSDQAISDRCDAFADMDAYKNAKDVEENLVKYWSTRVASGTAKSTSTSTSTSSSASATGTASSTSVTSTAATTPGSTLSTVTSKASTTSKSEDKTKTSSTKTTSTSTKK